MTTYANPNYFVRDGQRVNSMNGDNMILKALETSPADDTTETEVITWEGVIPKEADVCRGPKGGRFSAIRNRPLNAKLRGIHGPQSSLNKVLGVRMGDKKLFEGAPAIHYFGLTQCFVDVRYSGTYPIGTDQDSPHGTIALRNWGVRCSKKNLSVIRLIGEQETRIRNIEMLDPHDGIGEYLVYINAGHGNSVVRGLKVFNANRGAFQGVYRSTENNFFNFFRSNGSESLDVGNIFARNCGLAGSQAVSVWGWPGRMVSINKLDIWSPFDTAGVMVGFDNKQCDVQGQQGGPWIIEGPGKLVGGKATHTVKIDLSEPTTFSDSSLKSSRIRTGQGPSGQRRRAIAVDSCDTLYMISDAATSITAGVNHLEQAGTRSLELEWNGAGDIRRGDQAGLGAVVGSRAIDNVYMVGDFDGWKGGMRRRGGSYNPDEDRSGRRLL